MEGTGNDFVMIDNRSVQLSTEQVSEWAPRLTDRRFGIGGDGVIALDESQDGSLIMIYRNPDGSDAGMCGNGGRCFVRFAIELGFKPPIRFRVNDRIYTSEVTSNGVLLHFPLETRVQPETSGNEQWLNVYTNTEHIVLQRSQKELEEDASLRDTGRMLRHHQKFSPVGTNVNFIHGKGSDQLALKTWERGVEDLTLACGTGAIASALAWHHLQNGPGGQHITEVHSPGGPLRVHFRFTPPEELYSHVALEGAATIVFTGIYRR